MDSTRDDLNIMGWLKAHVYRILLIIKNKGDVLAVLLLLRTSLKISRVKHDSHDTSTEKKVVKVCNWGKFQKLRSRHFPKQTKE